MHGARKLYGPQLRIVAGVKSLNVPVSIVDLDFTPEPGPGRDGGEGIKWDCWKHTTRGEGAGEGEGMVCPFCGLFRVLGAVTAMHCEHVTMFARRLHTFHISYIWSASPAAD